MKPVTTNKSLCISLMITILIFLFGLHCTNRTPAVAFLTFKGTVDRAEIDSAFSFLSDNRNFTSSKIFFEDVYRQQDLLSDYDLVWFHFPDTCKIPANKTNSAVLTALKTYYCTGGKILLSQGALNTLKDLGLETIAPETRLVEANDDGYGRKRGLHAFRSHPVFNGLFGGSYIFSPHSDTTAWQTGYFNDEKIHANVIAVDWAYIRLQENKKLVLEYAKGKGKIIAVGAYMQFSVPNHHRKHFERFVNNTIDYLLHRSRDPAHYWDYRENNVTPFSPKTKTIPCPASESWPRGKRKLWIKKEHAGQDPWDISAERIVVMGTENSGIEEIWTHPVMALRDYEIGYRKESGTAVIWLTGNTPEIIIEPHAVTRTYHFENSRLSETICADVENPVGVIHYSFNGAENMKFYIRFKSNLRYMWPYSSRVTGSLNFARDNNQHAFIIKDSSEDFVSMLGANKTPVQTLIGQYNSVYYEGGRLAGDPGESFMVYAMAEFDLDTTDMFDIVISASSQGVHTTRGFYSDALKRPYSVYENSLRYYDDFLKSRLMITTPDREFNKGYAWALIGTDKFFVRTPGIGASLVAGYATTAHGWDGGHTVNGRPGYAWYFGRDGQWSGFAVDAYGDFEKVKSILRQYMDFQDITGKIYHELTTSGVVHYDAADATPLFIVLAGHYLRNSGDIRFIEDSWDSIKKAVDFCYSTDTDKDMLIENTSVGHGWVEGGHLFGGKSTLYLSSCWAEALKQAAYMAEHTGRITESKKYMRDHHAVVRIINSTFWNSRKQYFHHSINDDGSFITDITVMPAVPLLFSQIHTPGKAESVLNTLASNNFTSNWGARIISEESRHFNPRGYHTGSVWPLYTGWAALAEYKNFKPVQGYSHIMNNMLVYKDWASGYIEEVLHGKRYAPSGVCSHQCWSETMAVQPVIEGLLGLYPLAPDNTVRISPAFPFHWDHCSVRNISIGRQRLHMEMKKDSCRITYFFSLNSRNKLTIEFRPALPASVSIENILLNGKEAAYRIKRNSGYTAPEINIAVTDTASITIEYKGGISVLPVYIKPEPGDAAEGLRVVSEKIKNNQYRILFEAPSGSIHRAGIFSNMDRPIAVSGANIISTRGSVYTVRIPFKKSADKYSTQKISIDLN